MKTGDNHPATRKSKTKIPADELRRQLTELARTEFGECVLPNDIPKKWQKHGDLILIPANCLVHELWQKLGDKVWAVVAICLKGERVARRHSVRNDDFRTPQTELLRGEDGWVVHIDNGIQYTYDVTKCMFSVGNITEKLRISKFDCHGEIVVDLFAGIGYFTLPFLVHAKAKVVHACEWNPNAIEALKKSLALNNITERCIIHFGDNRLVCPKGVADRVNLGLIPSSEESWTVACAALKSITGGVLHVHGVVTSGLKSDDNVAKDKKSNRTEWTAWAVYVCSSLSEIMRNLHGTNWNTNISHVERVKSYAPHMDHIVVDVICKPCK